MVTIKLIHSKDTYSIRHKVLRPNQTINDCKYDSDEDENAFHLGAFKDDQLIGIGSFYLESHPVARQGSVPAKGNGDAERV